jgi:transcription elongation factor Elf1
MQQSEKYFTCPYCGETVSILLDLSVNGQVYIEDCEVCCRPIEIRYSGRNGEIAEFRAQRTE